MAHFAEIDENNYVVRVLVVPNEFESEGADYLAKTIGLGGRWIQTSYNGNFRGKFAGINDFYDEANDIFVAPPSVITDPSKAYIESPSDELATE